MPVKIGGVKCKAVPLGLAGGAYGPERYCIIDVSTGEIVDDAEGYGYRSEQKAYAGFRFRSKARASGMGVGAYARQEAERRANKEDDFLGRRYDR